MGRFAFTRYAFLSLLVVAATCGSSLMVHALTPEERKGLEQERDQRAADVRSLDDNIKLGEKLLKDHPWLTADCPWVLAAPGNLRASNGKKWALADFIATVNALPNQTPAAKQALIEKARATSATQAGLCKDPAFTNLAQWKKDKAAQEARIAAINAQLGAAPPPPPSPVTAWSGRWFSSSGSTFEITISGSKLICKGQIHSDHSDELSIYSTDDCEWNGGTAPVKCSYFQHEDANGVKWRSDGEATLEWKDGIIMRTAKASKAVKVEFSRVFAEGVLGDVAAAQKAFTALINDSVKDEKFRLRRTK